MTPEEARDALDGTTPGPWRLQSIKGHPHLRYITTGTGHSGDPTAPVCIPVDVTSREGAANMTLKAAAPTLAAMIANMREEWGVAVTYPGLAEVVEWGFCTRDGAESEGESLDAEYRIVRRYVTEPEEA